MSSPTFDAFTTKECTVRKASMNGGYTNASGLFRCSPLMPVSADTQTRLNLSTPHTKKETMMQGENPLVIKGCKLVVDNVEYPVVSVETVEWIPTGETFMRLVVEDLRNK